MTADEFIDEQLALIRKTFFAKTTEKQFYQERSFLLAAITFPAKRLKERFGVAADVALYRRILRTVIDTIIAKGNRAKIVRFSAYFLHCVQTHMDCHGEEYYENAKRARTAAELLPEALRGVYISNAAVTTDVLVGLHRALRGRRHKPKPQKSQIQLL
jgi:hypothetical protein